MSTLSLPEARLRTAAAQGLLAPSPDSDLATLVRRTGWIRTLGGAEAYLALRARRPGTTVDEVHAAVAAGDLQIVPAVRGCIYLVPRTDASLALRISRALDARRFARDLEKAGTSVEELDRVGQAVLEALVDGPLGTRALGKALADGVVRRLGDAGKKVGLTTTLPPALRRLEWQGRIVRRQRDDRLDHERYDWDLAAADPFVDDPYDDLADAHRALVDRFFAWAGPATLDAFVAWSGLGKRDARAAVAAAGLVEVEVEGLGARVLHPDVHGAPTATGRLAVLPALDNLTALHETAGAFVDPAHHDVVITHFGRPSEALLGEARHLFERVLTRDGRVVGLWAWDPAVAAPVHACWEPDLAEAALAAAADAAMVCADLGHGRTFSLDNDERLRARVDKVRAAR